MRDQSTSKNIYREWRRENCERRRCERANKRDTGRSEGARETMTGLHRVRVRVRGCRVRQTTLRRQFMPCDGRQISRAELWDLETLQLPISFSHSTTSPTTKVGTMITFYLFENITSARAHTHIGLCFQFSTFASSNKPITVTYVYVSEDGTSWVIRRVLRGCLHYGRRNIFLLCACCTTFCTF